MKRILFFILLSLIKLNGYAQMAVDANYPHHDNWSPWSPLYHDDESTVLYRMKLCGFVDKTKRCSLHNSEVKFKLTGSVKALKATAAFDIEKSKCNGSQELERAKINDKLVFTENKPLIQFSHSIIKMRDLQIKDVKK